jgi:FtsP/CotA-like multicopper oxidase with cupredoxin domain
MSRIHRIGVVLIALVAVVAAFVLLQPGEDPKATATAAEAGTPATTSVVAAPTTTTTRQAPPAAPLLTAGKVRTISVTHGDTVRFRVRSSVAEEVHVHGYDLTKDIEPGRTATMSFPAALEGVFEIEFEHSGTQIASLRVAP